MKCKTLANITPGEILEEEFLKPFGLSQYRLAMDIGKRLGKKLEKEVKVLEAA